MSRNWRIELFILVLVLLAIAAVCFSMPPMSVEKSAPRAAVHAAEFGDQYLRAWYREFNERLFYSQLPTNTIVKWNDLSENGWLGATYYTDRAHTQFEIDIDPELNNSQITAQETEIHEMCHVEVAYVEDDDVDSFNHGVKWEACMERIAAHGGFQGIW